MTNNINTNIAGSGLKTECYKFGVAWFKVTRETYDQLIFLDNVWENVKKENDDAEWRAKLNTISHIKNKLLVADGYEIVS